MYITIKLIGDSYYMCVAMSYALTPYVVITHTHITHRVICTCIATHIVCRERAICATRVQLTEITTALYRGLATGRQNGLEPVETDQYPDALSGSYLRKQYYSSVAPLTTWPSLEKLRAFHRTTGQHNRPQASPRGRRRAGHRSAHRKRTAHAVWPVGRKSAS